MASRPVITIEISSDEDDEMVLNTKVRPQKYKKFKINQAHLKKLRAVVNIELDRIRLPKAKEFHRVRANDEKMDTDISDDSELGSHLLQSPDHLKPKMSMNGLPNGYHSPTSPTKLCDQSARTTSPVRRLSQSPIKKYFVCDHKSPKKISLCLQKHLKPPTKLHAPITSENDSLNEIPLPATPIRNETVWPPSHVILNQKKFIKNIFCCSKLFCPYYIDTIEGLQDEKFFFAAVRTMQGLLMSNMAPPCSLVWSLVEEVLLKSRNRRLSVVTYCVLNEIHLRFPASCLAMNIEWSQVKALSKSILSLATNGTQLQFLNANLALLFVLTVLSSEMKSVALKSKPTRITKLFSADYEMRNVKEIIDILRGCLCNDNDACQSEKANCSSIESKGTFSANLICSLDFSQTLLKFIIVSSTNKEYVAIRIANELMYLYMGLTTLQTRVLMLRTIKSHLMRRKLIEVLLMNYCSLRSGALQGNEVPMSARKILLQDFHRFPPQRSNCTDDGSRTTEEVEEYVTLVAYLLQSYVVTHATLQSYHGDSPSFKCEEFKQFTEDDLIHFSYLSACTSALRERCRMSLAKPHMLSVRTSLLLEMMGILMY